MAFKKKIDIGSTDAFKFEKLQQSLEGYYVGTFDIVIDGRDVKKHVFQTSKGLVSVLGQAHLTQLLAGIEKGTNTRITYVGSKKTKAGRQPMKLFELEYDDEDQMEVAGIEDTRQQASEPAEQEEVYETSEDNYEEDVPMEQPIQRPRAAAPSPAARPAPRGTAVSPDAKARAQALLGGKK